MDNTIGWENRVCFLCPYVVFYDVSLSFKLRALTNNTTGLKVFGIVLDTSILHANLAHPHTTSGTVKGNFSATPSSISHQLLSRKNPRENQN